MPFFLLPLNARHLASCEYIFKEAGNKIYFLFKSLFFHKQIIHIFNNVPERPVCSFTCPSTPLPLPTHKTCLSASLHNLQMQSL